MRFSLSVVASFHVFTKWMSFAEDTCASLPEVSYRALILFSVLRVWEHVSTLVLHQASLGLAS